MWLKDCGDVKSLNKHLMLKNKIIYVLVIVLTASLTAQAQTKKQRNKRKAEPVKVEVKSEADELYDEMLASTAQLMVVDSVVTTSDDLINNIPLSPESGKIIAYDKLWNTTGQPTSYVYLNEFGNRIIYSEADKQGQHQLFMADKLGGKWTNKRVVDDFKGELEDLNHPFMMPDGVTLYFSAKSKDNLGGYDIYVTRYAADSARFYKPENIGLPYNSAANDYYCVIDEFNAIGWLATDRRQTDGKVCVYTFVPPASRTTYNAEGMDEQKLRSLADIRLIKDTWTDKAAVQAALERVESIKQRKAAQNTQQINFVINDNTVYTKLEDFKSADGSERFALLQDKKRKLSELEATLDASRKGYTYSTSEAKQDIGKTIAKQEEEAEQLLRSIKAEEKEIRNAENKILKP